MPVWSSHLPVEVESADGRYYRGYVVAEVYFDKVCFDNLSVRRTVVAEVSVAEMSFDKMKVHVTDHPLFVRSSMDNDKIPMSHSDEASVRAPAFPRRTFCKANSMNQFNQVY